MKFVTHRDLLCYKSTEGTRIFAELGTMSWSSELTFKSIIIRNITLMTRDPLFPTLTGDYDGSVWTHAEDGDHESPCLHSAIMVMAAKRT